MNVGLWKWHHVSNIGEDIEFEKVKGTDEVQNVKG